MPRTGGPGTSRSGGLVLVVLMALAIAAGGYVVTHRHQVEVALVGDSITVMLQAVDAKAPIDPGGTEIVAVSGMRAMQMKPQVDDLVSRRPRKVVINLGTNDLLQGRPAADALADVEALADELRPSSCVFVVTLGEGMVSLDHPDIGPRAQAFNAGLRSDALAKGDTVIDWAAVLAAHDKPGDPASPATLDTVHPSVTGLALLADAYRQAISSTPCDK